MLPPMQDADPPEYTEKKAPCHYIVNQGSRAKEAVASGGKAEGEHE